MSKKKMHTYYRDQLVAATIAGGTVEALCGYVYTPTRESVLDKNPGCAECAGRAVEGKGSVTLHLHETWADLLEAEYEDLKRRTARPTRYTYNIGTTSGWSWVA